MNINSYDRIGLTGYRMIDSSLKKMDALVEGMDKNDPASVAKANVEIAKEKVRTAQGMALVKAHSDLMDSTLILFGIGKCCNCRC